MRMTVATLLALAVACGSGRPGLDDEDAGTPTNGGRTDDGARVDDAGENATDAGDTLPDAGDSTADAGETTPDAGETTPDAGGPPDAGNSTNSDGFRTSSTDWTIPAGGWVDQGFVRTSGVAVEEGDDQWTLVDLDGDAKQDLVVTARAGATLTVHGHPATPHWKVFRNTGSGFATTATTWPVPSGGADEQGFFTTSDGGDGEGDQAWTLVDLDADARPDLVVTGQAAPALLVFDRATNPHWKVFRNTGTGFATTATTWRVPEGGWINQGFVRTSGPAVDPGDDEWSLLDLTGDGRPELVVPAHYGERFSVHDRTTNPHWRVFTNTGSGFNTTATTWRIPAGGWIEQGFVRLGGSASDAGDDEWSVADLDGDSRPDLVVTARATTTLEVFERTTDAHWRLFRNNGAGFDTTPARWRVPEGGWVGTGFVKVAAGAVEVGDDEWSLVDLDGDVKPELVVTAHYLAQSRFETAGYGSAPHWRVFRNSGSGFSRTVTTWGLPAGGWVQQGFVRIAGFASDNGDDDWTLTDLDGDQVPELVVTARHDGTRARPFSNGTAWHVHERR